MNSNPTVSDGVFYVGRPEWLSERWLEELRAEAQEARPRATSFRKEFFTEVGSAGRAFAESPELGGLVARRAVAAVPTNSASYLYYDQAGSELAPHIDTDKFVLNVLMNLAHRHVSERRSAFLLFPHGPVPIRIFLDPGTLILFHAGAVVHARSRTSANGDEWVWNIGIGFAPLIPLDRSRYWRPG